jgi:hypothetical protein
MNEALVEHAEHDIHRDHRCHEEKRLIGEHVLECRRGALERGDEFTRQLDVLLGFADRVDRPSERGAGREIERDGGRRKLSEVRDLQRAGALLYAHDRRQRNLPVVGGSG